MVGKKVCSPSRVKRPKRLSLSFTGSFISAKHNSMAAPRRVSSSSERASLAVTSTLVTGSAAMTTAHGRRRARHGIKNAFVEQLGIREEQRRVPTEEYQAGNQSRVGMAGDVVIALHTFDPAKYRGVGAPAIPEELDHSNHDGQGNAGNGTEHGHA